MSGAEAERQAIAEGGVWSDENIMESLEYAGESGSAHAAENALATHPQLTSAQIDAKILEQANIDPAMIAAITARVEARLSSSLMSVMTNRENAMTASNRSVESKVDTWIEKLSTEMKSQGLTAAARDELARLEERIAQLEQKLDAVVKTVTTHGPEEVRMIQEAYRIIKDRRAVEESDIASEPSVVARMASRTEAITEQLRVLEPVVETARLATVNTAAQRRKKFGRMI